MLTGDSAGANACLALTRYLDELSQNGSDWGLPGSLCLHSVSDEVDALTLAMGGHDVFLPLLGE